MTWKDNLHRKLIKESNKIALVGVGSRLHGDDAVGVEIAEALAALQHDNLLVLEAGIAPENILGSLGKFEPDVVIFIDGIEGGKQPGDILCSDLCDIEEAQFSGHSSSLALLAHYLQVSLSCEVTFLGVQVGHVRLGDSVSPEIRRAIDEICDTIHAAMLPNSPDRDNHPI